MFNEIDSHLPRKLPPGGANTLIEQLAAQRAHNEQLAADRTFLPDGAGEAQREIDRAQAVLADAGALFEREREYLETINGQVAAAAEVRATAERQAQLAQQDHEAALEAERTAFANGAEVVEVDVAGARAAAEAAARRVMVLRQEEAKAALPLAGARAAFDGAVARRREAAFRLARAKLVAVAAAHAQALVDELRPLFAEAENAARAGYKAGVGDLLSIGGVKRALAYALTSVLPPEALHALPAAPRRAAARIIAETEENDDLKVDAVVAAGNTYGKAMAGERVRVTPEELALQSRRSPIDGARMGALISLGEFELLQAAKVAQAEDPQSPRYLSSKIKAAVEKGLELLGVEAQEKKRAREAAEKRARQERELNQLAMQRIVDAADARGGREAQLIDKINGPASSEE